MQTNELYIPVGHLNRPGIKLSSHKAIIVHYTANDSPQATDTANAKYIARPYKKVGNTFYEEDGKTKFRYGSAHVFCDENSITRTIPYNEVAWGCGDRQLPRDNGYNGQTKIAKDIFNYNQNYQTISVEICNNGNWDKACANAIEEIKILMQKFNIPITMIFRHYDITGKQCPLPLLDNTKWNEFKNKLSNGSDNVVKETIKIKVNNQVIKNEDLPLIDGHLYMGIREICDLLGIQIDYANNTINIIKGGK